MSKIIEFSKDASFYYELAIKKSDLGDDLACLNYLNQAQALVTPFSHNDVTVRLERCDIYSKLGLYRESNRELFKLYDRAGDYLDEVFYGLIRNFFYMGNVDTAAFYLSLGVDSDIIDPFEVRLDLGFDEDMDIDPAPNLKLLRPQSNEYVMNLAKQLMAGNDPDYAKQVFMSIPSSSEAYIEATNCIALIELSQNNASKGLELVQKALQVEPDEPNSLMTRVLALKANKMLEEIDSTLEQIDAHNLTSWQDCVKMTFCCAEVDRGDYVYKYSKRALDISPYEREILMFFAIAAFNEGKVYEARQALSTLSIVYPKDLPVRLLAQKINDRIVSKDQGRLPFCISLDAVQTEQVVTLIEKELINKKSETYFGAKPMLVDCIMWALDNCSDSFIARLSARLSTSKNGTKLLQQALIEPDYSLFVKKIVLRDLLKNASLKKITVVVNNQIKQLEPSLPKVKVDSVLEGAYWQVFSSLAFVENSFVRKLNLWFKRICGAFCEENSGYSENAVAAVLAFKCGASKIFELSSYCCEVFDCEMQEFMLYLDIADKYLDLQKDKKVRSRGNND